MCSGAQAGQDPRFVRRSVDESVRVDRNVKRAVGGGGSWHTDIEYEPLPMCAHPASALHGLPMCVVQLPTAGATQHALHAQLICSALRPALGCSMPRVHRCMGGAAVGTKVRIDVPGAPRPDTPRRAR